MLNKWLTLQEYSSKYKISISTLRRRIKNKEVKYVFESGKYLIEDINSNLTLKDKDFSSFQNIQVSYKKLLHQKDQEIIRLKNDLDDMKHLIIQLEQDKKKLEEILKQSPALNPNPLL